MMPSNVERHVGSVLVEEGELRYERAGTGDAIVFIRAGVADRRMWHAQIASLAQQFDAIAYDMRGFGESPPTAGEHSPQRDLAQLLRDLEIDRPHLVGCSKGGETALDFALVHPRQVESLILVGSSVSGWESDTPPPPGYDEMVAAFEAGDMEAAAEAAVKMWIVGPNRPVEAVSGDVRSLSRSMALTILQNQAAGIGREVPPARLALAELETVVTPTLVVSGALDDPDILAMADMLASRIPGARAIAIEDAGHLSPLEKPEEFNRILVDFVRTVSTRSADEGRPE
jgi:pimeloyl-ACP methyl ester carboxylesterase